MRKSALIKVRLDPWTAEITCTKEQEDVLREYWSYLSPGAWYSPSYRLYVAEKAKALKKAIHEGRQGAPLPPLPGWDGRISFFKKHRVPAGLFRATKREILAAGFRFKIDRYVGDVRSEAHLELPPAEGEYQFQNTCVQKMRRSLPYGGGIVLSATGSGKTAMAARLFAPVVHQCLFVVDQKNLLYQSQKELSQWLKEPVGVVGDSKFELWRVTVATIQTLDRHCDDPKFMEWYSKVDIVMVDELHKQMARRNFDVLQQIVPLARIGLTATLEMKKKHVRVRAQAFAGPVIYTFPISEGIKTNVLTRGQAIQLMFPEQYRDDEDELNHAERYEHEVIDNESKAVACKLIVEKLIGYGRYVIVLADRIAHVKALHEMFANVPHRMVYGGNLGTVKGNRKTAVHRFEKGKIRLIVASSVFNTGVNIKRVDVIIDLAERPSKNNVLQKFGRGVRKHKDKTDLIYIAFGTRRGRLRKAARSQRNALLAAEIPVTTVEVESPKEAWLAVKKRVGGQLPLLETT